MQFMENLRGFAQSTSAKVGVGALALVPMLASAQSDPVADITAKVGDAMEGGLVIAGAVVVGLFAIWAVKLLWRAK